MRLAPLLVLIALAAPAPAKEKRAEPAKPAAPAPRGIVRTPATRGSIVDARIDGRLFGWTHVRAGEGRHEIVVLLKEPSTTKPVDPSAAPQGSAKPDASAGTVAPPPAACTVMDAKDAPDEHLRLARFDLRAATTIDQLRADIPGDAWGLAALDIDGDGRDELMLHRPGVIEMIAPGNDGRFAGQRMTIVEDPDIGGSAPSNGLGAAIDPAGPRIRIPVVGALRTWAPDPARPRWRTVSDAPTPFRAVPSAEGLHVVGPLILPCGRDESGRARFATAAEVVGRDRLRARLLDPEAAPESRALTCWMKLPSPERVLDQACVMIDGAPHLAMTTMSAEKLSFFGEKKLRVFPLSPDRSRTGAAARFAVTTGLNLWQPTTPELADVNGDGRADLVLAYWKGLKDSIAVLEVYLGKLDRGFEPSARRTEIELDDGEKNWIGWSNDADGDGRADLLVFAGKKLVLLPGVVSSDGRRLAASKPAASLPWPADAPDLGYAWAGAGPEGPSGGVVFGSMGVPRVSDLDGDKRVEVTLAGNDDAGGRIIVFSFASRP